MQICGAMWAHCTKIRVSTEMRLLTCRASRDACGRSTSRRKGLLNLDFQNLADKPNGGGSDGHPCSSDAIVPGHLSLDLDHPKLGWIDSQRQIQITLLSLFHLQHKIRRPSHRAATCTRHRPRTLRINIFWLIRSKWTIQCVIGDR